MPTARRKAMQMVSQKVLPALAPIGTEHEYSINDKDFQPLPISDRIIERISGEVQTRCLSVGSVI